MEREWEMGDGEMGMGWVVHWTIECPIGTARYDTYVTCVCMCVLAFTPMFQTMQVLEDQL